MEDAASRSDTTKEETRSQLDGLIDRLAQHGDQPLVQVWTATEPEQRSYRSIGKQVQVLARGLRQRTEPGEAVVLIGAERPEWLIAALAILRAGAVVTPLDVQLADDMLGRVLQDSAARWVFTTAAHQERVHTAGAARAGGATGWRAGSRARVARTCRR